MAHHERQGLSATQRMAAGGRGSAIRVGLFTIIGLAAIAILVNFSKPLGTSGLAILGLLVGMHTMSDVAEGPMGKRGRELSVRGLAADGILRYWAVDNLNPGDANSCPIRPGQTCDELLKSSLLRS